LLEIQSIIPSTPASAAGFKKTDKLISSNGCILHDWFDFVLSATGTSMILEYRRGLLNRTHVMRRNPDAEWGFAFKGQKPAACRKKCVFCFVDQLPPGVRTSLTLKDDDVRYSFLQGTYITLSEDDAEYAISKRLSPLHISVHSTDPSLRGIILGTGRMEPVVPLLAKLSDAGIELETQIVIVPGMNDGDRLDQTLEELLSIPAVISAGVVPVGLTKYRERLPQIRRSSPAESKIIVHQCAQWRKKAIRSRGTPWVYPSDEFFITAGLDIPPSSYYKDCTLRENGIGLIADILRLEGREFNGRGAVLSGILAAPFLKRILEGSEYLVTAVENSFLGNDISVAGLLSGADVIYAAGTLPDSYNRVILPAVMFNHDMLTLDDLDPDKISMSTGREIIIARRLEELI